MADELFPAEDVASESPRLRWLKAHGVVTFCSLPGTDDEEWFAGLSQWLDGYNPEIASNYGGTGWLVGCEGARNGRMRMGCGATESDAIADLACKNDIRLWNEEVLP